MKKVIGILICLLIGLVLVGCVDTGGNLDVPTNVKIEGTILTFDEVSGAGKYRIEFKNIADDSVQRRFADSGVDLNTLNINEGNYMVRVQALSSDGNKESEYSDGLEYKQIDLYAVKEIKEEALIDGTYIKWMGRTSYDQTSKVNTMYYSASGFEVVVKKMDESFTVKAVITGTNTSNSEKRPYIVIVKDNDFDNAITLSLTQAETEVELVGEAGFIIDDEEEHKIALYKRSESIDSHIALKSLTTTGKFVAKVEYKTRKIEVIAASSSTGYGNLGNSSGSKTTSNSDALKGFAFLTAQNLNAEINIVSASGWGISASRWTTPNTLNMKDKYKYVDVASTELWDTSSYVPDVIVTNFGTNDLSYINMTGITATEKQKRIDNFKSYYVEFLDYLHRTYPNAQIIVLYGLMQESGVYTYTEELYEEALKIVPNLELVKIVGDAQGCASHPSVASHKTIADSLTAKIKELMNW